MKSNTPKNEETGHDWDELPVDACAESNIGLSENRCPLSLYILGEEQTETDFNLYLTAGAGTVHRRDESQERTATRPYISAENLKKLKKLRFDSPVEQTNNTQNIISDDRNEKSENKAEILPSISPVPEELSAIEPETVSLELNSAEKEDVPVPECEDTVISNETTILNVEPAIEPSMVSVPQEPVLSRPEPEQESGPVVQTSSQAVIITMEKVRTDPEEEDGRFGIFDHFVRLINGYGPQNAEVIESELPPVSNTNSVADHSEQPKDWVRELPDTDRELNELCSLWNGLTTEQRESLSIFLRTLRRS